MNDTVLHVFQISRKPAFTVATSLVQHLFTIDLTNKWYKLGQSGTLGQFGGIVILLYPFSHVFL